MEQMRCSSCDQTFVGQPRNGKCPLCGAPMGTQATGEMAGESGSPPAKSTEAPTVPVETPSGQSFKVGVGRIKGPGYAGAFPHTGTLTIGPDALVIRTAGKSSTGAMTGALTGGLVGAMVGHAMDKATAGLGHLTISPRDRRAHYDEQSKRFNVELPDGMWAEVLPGKRVLFDDILTAFREAYGQKLTPLTLGRISERRQVLLCVMAGLFSLTPGLGLLFGPVVLITLVVLGAVRKRFEAFQIVATVICVIGLFLNLFVYALGSYGRTILGP